MSEKWRLIIDPSSSGCDNMATDEALLLAASSDGVSAPVLRIYGWAEPTLSIGYLQKAAEFMDTGLPLVRRITGGRALLHDDELTYAVIAGADSELYAMGISMCYSAISRAIAGALNAFGVAADFARPLSPRGYRRHRACFASSARYEVLVGGKKIAGSAQRRLKGALLQHGSIMFGIDSGLWSKVFGAEVLDKTATLMDLEGRIDREAFRDTFIENISQFLGASFTGQGLTEYEKELRQRLITERYSRKEWNEKAEGRESYGGTESLQSGLCNVGK